MSNEGELIVSFDDFVDSLNLNQRSILLHIQNNLGCYIPIMQEWIWIILPNLLQGIMSKILY